MIYRVVYPTRRNTTDGRSPYRSSNAASRTTTAAPSVASNTINSSLTDTTPRETTLANTASISDSGVRSSITGSHNQPPPSSSASIGTSANEPATNATAISRGGINDSGARDSDGGIQLTSNTTTPTYPLGIPDGTADTAATLPISSSPTANPIATGAARPLRSLISMFQNPPQYNSPTQSRRSLAPPVLPSPQPFLNPEVPHSNTTTLNPETPTPPSISISSPTAPPNVLNPNPSLLPVSNLSSSIRSIARSYSIADLDCIVCMERQRKVVFQPCCHILCCHDCAVGMKICPNCRTEIESTLHVYF